MRFTADLPDLNVWLVRLLSQQKLMGTSVKSGTEASAFLQGFCRQPSVSMAAPGHCTDAYVAALAMAHGWRLVSFDREFQRFADLHWLALP